VSFVQQPDDAPELGNEDPEFERLLNLARSLTLDEVAA
jgi:hypothetical protein